MPQRPTTSAFRRPRPTTLALTVVMLGAFIGRPGFAQSESEIRHQEARQSQQIQDLEAEVIALQTRLTTLEQVVRTLQARIQAMSAIGETVEPTVKHRPAGYQTRTDGISSEYNNSSQTKWLRPCCVAMR